MNKVLKIISYDIINECKSGFPLLWKFKIQNTIKIIGV